MLTYFCIYSIIGYFMESTYISILKRKWISSGLLDGPYIPLYGFGACILISIYNFLSKSYILTFVLGAILLTILEYLTSLFIEYLFHKRCWDYSKHIFNYQGRICLFYSIIWGLLSLFMIFYFHPLIMNRSSVISELLSVIISCIIIKDFIKKRIVM